MSNTPNGGDKAVLEQGRTKVPSHHNRYPLGYRFANSERFAEINPFFKYRGTDGDKNVLLHSSSTVDSMSLNAPILQSIRKNLDFYQVDMRAILPRTYEYIKSLPEHGDDIDARKANCLICFRDDVGDPVLADGISKLACNVSPSVDLTFVGCFQRFMRFLAVWDSLFSPDSLFASFRMPLADFLDPRGGKTYIDMLNLLWEFYHDVWDGYVSASLSQGRTSALIQFLDSANDIIFTKSYDFASVSDRMQFYYDFLENPNYTSVLQNAGGIFISDFTSALSSSLQKVKFSELNDYFDAADGSLVVLSTFFPETPTPTGVFQNMHKPINIESICAYQLSCAEFFTNDHVDYIFDAKLYRQLFESFLVDNTAISFNYNGLDLPYDGFSAVVLDDISISLADSLSSFNLFLSLITKKRSLRYKDYFTGSRTTPLAIGDNNIQVNNNVASVIDITQKIQLVRLRMAVQRVGRRAKDYINRVLGGDYRPDVTIPVKIGHIDTTIYNEETQNTAESQLALDNSRTAVLKNHTSKFGFETDCDVDSIIIGLSSYDIVRFYDRGFDPFALKVDRFDMFIPEMQYIGDQPISRAELNAGLDVDLPFAYTGRHMEYKTAVDFCSGAFRTSLAPWIFVQPSNGVVDSSGTFLNPDFIRAHQNELDRYYVALTGTTPLERYHFICKYHNNVWSSRNMVVAPNILR